MDHALVKRARGPEKVVDLTDVCFKTSHQMREAAKSRASRSESSEEAREIGGNPKQVSSKLPPDKHEEPVRVGMSTCPIAGIKSG